MCWNSRQSPAAAERKSVWLHRHQKPAEHRLQISFDFEELFRQLRQKQASPVVAAQKDSSAHRSLRPSRSTTRQVNTRTKQVSGSYSSYKLHSKSSAHGMGRGRILENSRHHQGRDYDTVQHHQKPKSTKRFHTLSTRAKRALNYPLPPISPIKSKRQASN